MDAVKGDNGAGGPLTTVETLESAPAMSQAEILEHVNTLGSVRLHNVHTKELILVPQPSTDPKDPLNRSVCISIVSVLPLFDV